MNLFKKLRELSIPAIYALECPRTRFVYLTSTLDCLGSLNALIRALNDKSWPSKQMIRDRRSLGLKILDRTADSTIRNSLMVFYINYYEKLGYKFYRKPKATIYKAVVTIREIDGVLRPVVVLRSRGNRSMIVGIFDHMDEALGFKEQYYSGEVIIPIYCTNIDTKKYCTKVDTDI